MESACGGNSAQRKSTAAWKLAGMLETSCARKHPRVSAQNVQMSILESSRHERETKGHRSRGATEPTGGQCSGRVEGEDKSDICGGFWVTMVRALASRPVRWAHNSQRSRAFPSHAGGVPDGNYRAAVIADMARDEIVLAGRAAVGQCCSPGAARDHGAGRSHRWTRQETRQKRVGKRKQSKIRY